VICLTDFFDAASQCHNDLILLPAIRGASGNVLCSIGTVHRPIQPDILNPQLLRCFVADQLWFMKRIREEKED